MKVKPRMSETELKLVLNAEQYRTELAKVVQDAKLATAQISEKSASLNVETEAAGSKLKKISAEIKNLPSKKNIDVEVDASNAISKIKAVASETEKTGNNMAAADKTSQGFFSSFKSGAGGAFEELKDGNGALKEMAGGLKGLLSPLGALCAGFVFLAGLVKECWDKMSMSAEEYAAKLTKAADNAILSSQKETERTLKAQEYLDKLQEISESENKSAESIRYSKSLVAALKEEYGDLGISINTATDNVNGLEQAHRKLFQQSRKRRMELAEKEYYANTNAARKLTEAAFTTMAPGEAVLNKLGLSIREVKEVKDGADKIMREESLEKRLKFAKNMYDRVTASEDVEAWQKVIDALEKAVDARKRYNSLKKTGYQNSEEQLAAEEKRRAKEQQKQAEADAKASAETEAFNQAERGKSAVESAIRKRQRQIEDRDDPDGVERRLQKDVEERKRMLEIHRENIKAALRDGEYGEDSLEHRQEQITEQQLKLELLEAEDRYSSTVAARERKEAENLAARKKATADLLTSAGEQLELQRALAAGDQDRIAALKLEAELKAKNLELTGEELEKLKEIRAQQGSQQLYGGMLDQAYAMRGRLREQSGDGKMFATDKALLDAEKRKGGSLTDDESRLVRDLAGLDYEIQHAAAFKLSGGVQTNALTQRGGFASGALTPDKDKINKEISANTKKIATMLDRANDLQKEIRDKLGT